MTTTDGQEWRFTICSCGKQNTAGICEHVNTLQFLVGGLTIARPVYDPSTLRSAGEETRK